MVMIGGGDGGGGEWIEARRLCIGWKTGSGCVVVEGGGRGRGMQCGGKGSEVVTYGGEKWW